MEGPVFVQEYRGVRWTMQALTVDGTTLTVQVRDRTLSMPASVLEFSLWDARCRQIQDLTLSSSNVELLRPWLRKMRRHWRLGWQRKPPARKKARAEDKRQLKLF